MSFDSKAEHNLERMRLNKSVSQFQNMINNAGKFLDFPERSINIFLISALLVIAIFQVIAQLTLFTGIGPDDAQLVLWAQDFRFGVRDQPTLLSNLAWFFWELGLDPRTFIIIIRQLLVFSAILVFHQAFRTLDIDNRVAWIAAMAITLIPDVHRNGLTVLTHAVLMTFTLSLAFYALARIVKEPSIGNYFFLGFCAALLFHSKYNATLFFAFLFPLALWDPVAKKVIQAPKIWLTVGLFLLLTSPVVIWGMTNTNEISVTSSKYAFGAGGEGIAGHLYAIQKVIESFADNLKYVGVFILLVLSVAARPYHKDRVITFLGRYFLLFFIIAVIVAAIGEVGQVKRRWLVPGVMFAACLAGLWAARNVTTYTRNILLFVLIIFWGAANTSKIIETISPGDNGPKRLRVDISPLAKKLENLVSETDLIIAHNTISANLILKKRNWSVWGGETPWSPKLSEKQRYLYIRPVGQGTESKLLKLSRLKIGSKISLRDIRTIQFSIPDYQDYKRSYILSEIVLEQKEKAQE